MFVLSGDFFSSIALNKLATDVDEEQKAKQKI
jgi:hypothetical protein